MDKQKRAVKAAALYLEMRGIKVIEENYQTRSRVIDVIASRSNEVYFVTVKLAKKVDSSPVDILLMQSKDWLRSAARVWLEDNKWTGRYHYSMIELSPDGNAVLSFTDDII